VETTIDEISDGIYRLSTYIPDQDFMFNQFLVDAEDPLLFHCGLRGLFPLVSEAAARVVSPERLRWITFGHYEADECGSMNHWLAVAPRAQVAHGAVGVMVSVTDAADRPPRQLADGEVLDLGGKRVRWIDTPQVPHGWDAGLLYEESTGTLFCGDLFTALGPSRALTSGDLVEPAIAAEDAIAATALTPATAPTIRALATLSPTTLALMHGPSFSGDGAGQLEALATDYERRLLRALEQTGVAVPAAT
jgi:flavorubredoxin